MKAASLFLTNLLNIQISYAVCNHFSVTTFSINFFILSLFQENDKCRLLLSIECSFHIFPLNCLSCSNAAENSSKNDSFIRKEKQTSAPKQMAESNSRLSAPRGLLVSHQMFVYTVAIYLSISDDVDASSIDQKYM